MTAITAKKNPGAPTPGHELNSKPAKLQKQSERSNSTGVPYHQRVNEWQRVLTDWALAYARQGFPVFPVRGDKRPYVKWSKEASTDPVKIMNWWGRWPLAMIGMPTGKRTGIVVLDVDCKNGVDGLQTLKRMDFEIPAGTVTIATPNNGFHFYFEAPDDELPSTAGKIGPGVDIRAEGGMIILPPSRPDIDGLGYDYSSTMMPDGTDLERGQLLWP